MILTLLFVYIFIIQVLGNSEYKAICDCVHGFHSIPSDVIGWSCNGNSPELDVCNGSYSNWDGIECSDNNIIGVALSSYGIEGTLSSSFGSFVYLAFLQLDYNTLYSTIPSTLGDLSNLLSLELNNNLLSGNIPTSFGKLSKLQTLYIHENHFTGSIPSNIGMMDNLMYLRLYANFLTNTIPSSVGQLIKLKKFNVYFNLLTGTIPSAIGYMESVTSLRLDFNKLTGTIPSAISKLKSVIYINPSVNSLTGTIPTAIGLLSGIIEQIYLNNNLLTGTIPSVLMNCTNLLGLDFSVNHLEGTIPHWFFRLSNAYFLGIGTNHFSGTIPSTLMYATNLEAVEIGANSFTGSIPTMIGMLTGLTTISLRYNSFTGTIPTELGLLTNLVVLYLHNNQFIGSLPQTLKNIVYLSKIFVSSNFMTGTIPSFIWSSSCMLYIDCSHNKIIGTIPTFIRNATAMQKLAVTDTHLHGTLPSEIGYLTNLQYLYLSSNQLTGTLPSTIGNLHILQYLDLHSNIFHGTLPTSLSTLPLLVDLYLRSNDLEGPFAQAINTTYQPQLRNIDVSDNYLTGTIPTDFFFSSSLVILAATSNCLVFPQLEDGCTASKLEVLSLDGLRTAEKCRKFFWSMIKSSETYMLEYEHVTRIPNCLYRLPKLSVLHLSGNALTGTIPSDVVLGPSLTDLTLSYNRLHGTIPEVIQERNWTTLDLSFNSFSGTLSSSIPPVRNNKLALTINRLSGWVPQSLLQSTDISILKGNLFQCDFNNAKLPSGDRDSTSYSCGSDTFLLALYIFLGTMLAKCVIHFLLTPLKFWDYVYTLLRSLYPVSNGSEIAELILRFCSLFGMLTMFIIFIMMPVYGVLSSYYGTYTEEYAWSVSAGFLSGFQAKIIMLIVWSVMLLYFLVCYQLIFNTTKSTVQLVAVSEQPPMETLIDVNPRGLLWDNLVLIFLFLINIVVVFGANVAYVFTTLRGNAYAVIIAQILLGIFKVIWRYGYIEYIGYFRDCITGHTHRNKHELLFLTLMLIVNNVVLPVFSEVVIDTNCIYNMFVTPDTVTVAYTYKTCYLQSTDCDVLTVTTVDITYIPPFIYRYQCSAIVIINYVSVYFYMFIFTTLQVSLSSMAVWIRGHFLKGSWLYCIISLGVHQLHSDISYLNYPLYVAGLISSLAILVTFGAGFPPLALIIMIAIYVDAIYVTNILPQEAVPVPIDDLRITIYLIPFSALFFSFCLYDTAEYHRNSWVNLWAPMTVVLISILYYTIYIWLNSKKGSRSYHISSATSQPSNHHMIMKLDFFTLE